MKIAISISIASQSQSHSHSHIHSQKGTKTLCESYVKRTEKRTEKCTHSRWFTRPRIIVAFKMQQTFLLVQTTFIIDFHLFQNFAFNATLKIHHLVFFKSNPTVFNKCQGLISFRNFVKHT